MASTSLAVRNSALAMMPQSLDESIRLANLMATNDTLPPILRGSSGNCLMIVEQAMRWGMSVYAVAQCTFECRGKIGYEGKLVHAALENSGVITDEGFDDVYEGSYPEGDWLQNPPTRKIILTATRIGQSKPRTIELSWVDAYTTTKDGKINQQWAKPSSADQMLYYLATRMWVRRYAPAVLLGVYTKDEIENPQKYDTSDAHTIEGFVVREDEGTARERADEAVRQSAEHTAARQEEQNKEDHKDAEKVYPFNTMRFSRQHRTAESWLADWQKFVKGCVAADAPDRLNNTYQMNLGSIDEVGKFDWEARSSVVDAIEAGMKEIKEKREAAEAARRKADAGKPGNAAPEDSGAPDDGAPPNTGEDSQGGTGQSPTDEGKTSDEASVESTPAPQTSADQQQPPQDQRQTEDARKQEWLAKSDRFIGQCVEKIQSFQQLPDAHMAASRIANMLTHAANISILVDIRKAKISRPTYNRLIEACADKRTADEMMHMIQGKNDTVYFDLVDHFEGHSAAA